MKINMGNRDRFTRSILAVAALWLVAAGAINGALAIVASVVATIFILTSAINFCPLYAPFRFSTRGKKGAQD